MTLWIVVRFSGESITHAKAGKYQRDDGIDFDHMVQHVGLPLPSPAVLDHKNSVPSSF
jgi:hypothetical protein